MLPNLTNDKVILVKRSDEIIPFLICRFTEIDDDEEILIIYKKEYINSDYDQNKIVVYDYDSYEIYENISDEQYDRIVKLFQSFNNELLKIYNGDK